MVFELLEIYKIGYKHSTRNRVAVYGRCRAVIIVKQYGTLMIVVNIHTDLAGILIFRLAFIQGSEMCHRNIIKLCLR